jgi:hypothetical protein
LWQSVVDFALNCPLRSGPSTGEGSLGVGPSVGTATISYLRSKSRLLKDGQTQTYRYRVEGVREKGKVRQKVVQYLGTNPHVRTIPLDPALTARVALALIEGQPTATRAAERRRGLDPPGHPRQFALTCIPPPTLRFAC